MREDLNIRELIRSCSYSCGWVNYTEDALNYLEYVINIFIYVDNNISNIKNDSITINKSYSILKRNLDILIDKINYEYKYFKNEEKTLLIEKNPSSTAVAEIVEEELAFKVLEYNHHLLKGNINRKKEILKALADKIEPFRKDLDKGLSLDFGFAANELNIRHNNLEGEKKVPYVANMNEEELEIWYDKTYQIMLLCILENEYNKSIKKTFKQLRKDKDEYKKS